MAHRKLRSLRRCKAMTKRMTIPSLRRKPRRMRCSVSLCCDPCSCLHAVCAQVLASEEGRRQRQRQRDQEGGRPVIVVVFFVVFEWCVCIRCSSKLIVRRLQRRRTVATSAVAQAWMAASMPSSRCSALMNRDRAACPSVRLRRSACLWRYHTIRIALQRCRRCSLPSSLARRQWATSAASWVSELFCAACVLNLTDSQRGIWWARSRSATKAKLVPSRCVCLRSPFPRPEISLCSCLVTDSVQRQHQVPHCPPARPLQLHHGRSR